MVSILNSCFSRKDLSDWQKEKKKNISININIKTSAVLLCYLKISSLCGAWVTLCDTEKGHCQTGFSSLGIHKVITRIFTLPREFLKNRTNTYILHTFMHLFDKCYWIYCSECHYVFVYVFHSCSHRALLYFKKYKSLKSNISEYVINWRKMTVWTQFSP